MEDLAGVIRGLSGALRQAVAESDPDTGEIGASGPAAERIRSGLIEHGLAVPGGARGSVYLTAAGRRVREKLSRPAPPDAAEESSVFGPLEGGEIGVAASAGRADEVRQAWESLLAIRRLEGADGRPAVWEVRQVRRAVALALEGAGEPAAAKETAGRWVRAGYRVIEAEAGAVRVEWRGPAATWGREDADRHLEVCARVLAERGWESERYLGTGRVPYLRVIPRRPAPR